MHTTHAWMRAYMHAYIQSFIHTCVQLKIHTYVPLHELAEARAMLMVSGSSSLLC